MTDVRDVLHLDLFVTTSLWSLTRKAIRSLFWQNLSNILIFTKWFSKWHHCHIATNLSLQTLNATHHSAFRGRNNMLLEQTKKTEKVFFVNHSLLRLNCDMNFKLNAQTQKALLCTPLEARGSRHCPHRGNVRVH